MYQIDFANPCKVYFMGIGGISMSGLAEILLDAGFTVSGSDMKESELTKALEMRGVKVHYKQVPENIDASKMDVVVYTAAMHDDHPELAEVIRQGIPRMPRADLLGQIMRNYKTAFAISGTHGKTTTTTICKTVFEEFKNTGYLIGDGEGFINKNSEYLCVESCEFRRHFLAYYPEFAIITNIEIDHVDYFKDEQDYFNAYQEFVKNVKEAVFYFGDDPWCKKLKFNKLCH